MNPPDQEYAFRAPVLRMDDYFGYHYVPIPEDFADALISTGTRRVISELNGHAYRRAIQNRKDGEHFVILGQDILRDLRVSPGDNVTVVLRSDPNPDFIELGEEFTAVLEQDEEAAARFFSFTRGRQRSLASYATSAKRPETRLKRALELAHKIKTRTLSGDLQQKG